MDWTDSDSAKAVLEWAENGYLNAMANVVKKGAEVQGNKTMRKFWDDNNPDDGFGSFGTNPYQENERDSERIHKLNVIANEWKATLDFVRNRICDMVK